MLDVETRRRIDTARDILVGRVPDPKSQVEQITLALMYKFMDDMDVLSESMGGKASFFAGDFARYSWRNIVGPRIGAYDAVNTYSDGITRMGENPGLPTLFRSMFSNAYLPFRDPETLRSFLQVIGEFEYENSERLGDAFEYLLSIMGSQGDAGQFRTPRHIIDFIVEIIDPKKDEIILDPACGTAGFLISAYKHILGTGMHGQDGQDVGLTPGEKAQLVRNVRGYDISPDMVRLSLVNLYLHGFPDPDIFEYDTLTSEERWNEYANVILANPPFMSPKGGIRPHNRFSVTSKRSEVLFVDYIAEHLTPDGRAGVIVPEGIIFQSQNAHKQLRKMLVEEYLVAVVSLPPGVFNPYSGVKTSILILDKALARRSDSIGFFKVENDGFDLGAQRRLIDRNDLPQVKAEVKEYLRLVRGGIYMDERDEGDVSYEFETGLVVEKERIGADGEFNLSGERYRAVNQQRGKFTYVRIDQVCTVNPKKRELNGLDPSTEVSFLPMADLAENQMVAKPYQRRTLADVSASYSYFAENDVLVARVTPCFENGKAGVATGLTNHIGFGSSEFHVLRCGERILPQWAYFCVTHPEFRHAAILNMTGTGGLQRVPRDFIEDFAIPVPPMEVQREIVSEIEGYQKVIDGARAVVENWRPKVAVDPEWPVVPIKEACTVNPKKRELNGFDPQTLVSFIPMADVREHTMHIRPHQEKIISDVAASYSYFRDDDILVARVTPCFENGKAGIATGLTNGVGFGSSEFHVLRSRDDVLPEWVYLCTTEPNFRESAIRHMRGTGGLQRVPRRFVEDFPIPFPPLHIQQDLISEIQVEREMVEGNRRLIEVMEYKVRDVVGRVWGE